jgi:UDP-N-acetylglucosamine 2-epimerase
MKKIAIVTGARPEAIELASRSATDPNQKISDRLLIKL